MLLEKCAANDDTKLISEIAQVISWSKLWDQALEKGPRCVNGLKALVRIITYPSHATRVCPKCDVNELEVSLLAHILLLYLHIYNVMYIPCWHIFYWSTLMPDLVNRCITELRS